MEEAYNELRDREFKREFPGVDMTFVEASKRQKDPRTPASEKESLKEKLEVIKLLIPFFVVHKNISK